jgi:hypothetical protein
MSRLRSPHHFFARNRICRCLADGGLGEPLLGCVRAAEAAVSRDETRLGNVRERDSSHTGFGGVSSTL